MQNDLIDRKELIEKMTEEYKKHYAGDVSASGFTIAMEMVRNQPTAYDVEKVVEEVSAHSYIMGFDKSEVGLLVDDIRNGGKE